MARIAGDSGEVLQQAKYLRNIIKEILEKTRKGHALLDGLSSTSKDKSYEIAEGVVSEVEIIMKNGMVHCADVVDQLVEYSKFLRDLEG